MKMIDRIAQKLFPDPHTEWLHNVSEDMAVPVLYVIELMREFGEEAFNAGLEKGNVLEFEQLHGFKVFPDYNEWLEMIEKEKTGYC
jgi:hypothetical protein